MGTGSKAVKSEFWASGVHPNGFYPSGSELCKGAVVGYGKSPVGFIYIHTYAGLLLTNVVFWRISN